ncbi:hypothetical protein ACH4TC_00890 [Streptomyces spororaveus]|uniref:hypothetical protein n=1 Tax=Streptomyces spororaveus TaxID=284039 RepID=UPI003793B555
MTPPPRTEPTIVSYYADAYEEADRLHATATGCLELQRTRELLTARFPGPPPFSTSAVARVSTSDGWPRPGTPSTSSTPYPATWNRPPRTPGARPSWATPAT